MKIVNKKSWVRLIGLLFISTAVIMGCKKDNSNNATNTEPAHINIINAVDGSASQDFYLDNAVVTTSAVAYGRSSGSFQVPYGNHQAKFNDAGTETTNTSFSISLDGGNSYNIYYTGNDTTNTALVTENNLLAPPSAYAKVRFLYLNKEGPQLVDFALAGSTKLVTKLTYKTISGYFIVNPTSTFSLYASGSINVLLSIPADMVGGKIYTIYVTGSSALTFTYNIIAEN
jgi:hypothetical protein